MVLLVIILFKLLQGSQGREETCQVRVSVVLRPCFSTVSGKLCGCLLCHNLVSESVPVGNWHNELSVREANSGKALLEVVLAVCLLNLSTTSLLGPLLQTKNALLGNLPGESACPPPLRRKFPVLSLRGESQLQPQLGAPRLCLQSSDPVSQQQLVQDQLCSSLAVSSVSSFLAKRNCFTVCCTSRCFGATPFLHKRPSSPSRRGPASCAMR